MTQQRKGLLKVLGLAFGLAVLVGNTIGMGILRTPGEVAEKIPSAPLFMAVWVIGAVYALLGALSVAELGAMNPRSGGLYPLVHDALGPYPGFLVGWTDWFSMCGSAAAVSLVFAEYLRPLIPALTAPIEMIAAVVIIAFGLLQWRGIKVGDLTQQVTSLLKTVMLIGLAGLALFVTPDATPSAPTLTTPGPLPIGLALMSAMALALRPIIFTYDGWTGPIYFSEEVRNPGRDIPRSMIAGVLLVLTIYLILNFAFLRVIPINEMAGDPFVASTVALRLFGPTGETVLRVVTVVSLLAAINALILIGSRVPFAMSSDGLLPAGLQKVNPGGTPVPSLFLTVALALVLGLTSSVDAALALLAFFFVTNYALTFYALFVLRRKAPDAVRPFRVPWYPFVPGVALIGSVLFLYAAIREDLPHTIWAIGVVALSFPGYWITRSLLRK